MNKLKIELKNCYGISHLNHEFDFKSWDEGPARAYAVYAPNGLMKTSFAKTFEDLSKGESPREARYGRHSSHVVQADGAPVPKEVIHVLGAKIDIEADSPAITNILVNNPDDKARYDGLHAKNERLKAKLIAALQAKSKVKKPEIEQAILNDWQEASFSVCIRSGKEASSCDDLSPYEYATIFDPKATEAINSGEFDLRASEFSERYHELFRQAGTIYLKGVFNPAKAKTAFSALQTHGFFEAGHRVHLRGESESIDKEALEQKLARLHASIDGDEALKKLREILAKNAQTQAFTQLIESLHPSQIEFLLEKLKPANRIRFKRELWSHYIKDEPAASAYLEALDASRVEMEQIETRASQVVPRWVAAINLFNDRFIDMPFTLALANQPRAVLGMEAARLKFIFTDGSDSAECSRAEIQTLSQGEQRALYLLNFIFEVEERKITNRETLFVVDDPADSFDYKNKQAIIQYLADLREVPNFHQIILTHNFDFFRALAITFVNYERCLVANRVNSEIKLSRANGIKNYFVNIWKRGIDKSKRIVCATIPFTRNLIEYTKGEEDLDYLKLTSMLHWKEDTNTITVADYMRIYNNYFGTAYAENENLIMKDLILNEADVVASCNAFNSLNLEDKVLLSIAIRLRSEIFLVDRIRQLRGDSSYWCTSQNQFGKLLKDFKSLEPLATRELSTLGKVSITVSSNIHLNSFMYEPILDLTIDHLVSLYDEVKNL